MGCTSAVLDTDLEKDRSDEALAPSAEALDGDNTAGFHQSKFFRAQDS